MYSLHELAERSGIEARTIRSYIEKGLLPPAEARGPKSHYTDDHLDRLRVIQLLRQAHPAVALQDIRLVLQQLTPEQIEAIADGQVAIGGLIEIPQSPRPPDSALEYLSALREQRLGEPARIRPHTKAAPARSGEQRQTAVDQLADALRALAGPVSAPGAARRQAWCRFEVTPDIELHVRGGYSDEQLVQFQRIADLLRHVLTRGPRGRGAP